MWSLIALAIAAVSLDPKQTVFAKGTRFGPRQHLTCEWFSNFENSRFEKCRVHGGPAVDLGEGASLECLVDTCEQLDAEARRITR